MVKFTRKDERLVIEINLKKLIAIVVSVAVLAVFIGGISVGYALFAPDKRAEMKTGPRKGPGFVFMSGQFIFCGGSWRRG